MKTCHHLALATGIVVIALASAQVRLPAVPNAPASVPFSVTLAIPKSSGENGLDLNNPQASLEIILKNVSSLPQTIWKDWCSDGYYTVSLRVIAINGKTLSKPVAVTRGGHDWSANFPDPQTVKPGEKTVRHLLISELKPLYYVLPDTHSHHNGKTVPADGALLPGPTFPRLNPRARSEKISAVAVLDTLEGGNTRANNAHYGVWSGRAVSAPVTFTVRFPAVLAGK